MTLHFRSGSSRAVVAALTVLVCCHVGEAQAQAASTIVDCAVALKKPLAEQTRVEYDTCTKPALQKALCDAVEEAARTNGCGKPGTQDPRCAQLSHVLLTCLRDSSPTAKGTTPAPARQ